MVKKSFAKGHMICEENSPGSEMYIINEGKVKVYKTLDGEELHLGFLEKGEFFGEMVLLLQGSRTASVKAVEDTELVALSREDLMTKIRDDPHFGMDMITTLATRLADAHEVICDLAGIKKSLEMLYSSS